MGKCKLSVGWLDPCHQIHLSHTHRPTNENVHILPSLTFLVLLSLSLSLCIYVPVSWPAFVLVSLAVLLSLLVLSVLCLDTWVPSNVLCLSTIS